MNVMQNAYHNFSVMRKYIFSMQLFLYFGVGLAPSVGQELEIIVEESLTVKEVNSLDFICNFGCVLGGKVLKCWFLLFQCLKEMLQMAKLDGKIVQMFAF